MRQGLILDINPQYIEDKCHEHREMVALPNLSK